MLHFSRAYIYFSWACARCSWECAHLQLSMYTLAVVHVHAFSWTCERLQLCMCVLSVNPYVRRSRHHSASFFGSIFWKSTKCAKMMIFEHLRGAKWLEKCIVFEKKCLPGEERPEHRWNHCGMLPYQNSYRKMDKMAKFEAFWTSVRLKTKIQDNFFRELYTFCDIYPSTQVGMWVCRYRK